MNVFTENTKWTDTLYICTQPQKKDYIFKLPNTKKNMANLKFSGKYLKNTTKIELN